MSSIKKQIKARIKTVLDPLKPGTFREIEWKRTLLVLQAITPSLHLVASPESVLEAEEDFRGFVMEFVVALKIFASDERDLEGKVDDLVEAVQDKIESDPQLNQLANWCKYEGDDPFVNEVDKPAGGTILYYRVQYRREKANVDAGY